MSIYSTGMTAQQLGQKLVQKLAVVTKQLVVTQLVGQWPTAAFMTTSFPTSQCLDFEQQLFISLHGLGFPGCKKKILIL